MSRMSLNSKKNRGGTLHHTLNADHTRKATGQAVNKCSIVSSESSHDGHLTEEPQVLHRNVQELQVLQVVLFADFVVH
ncbi:hypothetical protein HanRHA438_Chr10g0462381 [Helianthus annuus]|nr:hypothetical protein HanRHA438_Chr10g0462381 [Helianthus annuus]